MLPRALLVLMPVIAAAMSASDAGGTTLDGCTGCSDWCTRDCPATCTGVSNNHTVWTASPVPVATVVNGKRFSAGGPDLNPNIALVHVYGTAYEMGYAQGTLLTKELAAFLPQALKYIAESITAADVPPIMTQVYAKSGVNGCLDFLFNLTKPSIAKYFLDELQGQADGSGLDLALFHRVAMLGELTKMGCSMIGAWGPAVSRTSGLVQLRALDWDTDGPFQAYPVVLVRHPSGGGQNAFATVGWAGDVGAITGYSSAGVGISEKVWIHYAGKSSWSGTPTTFALRDILQFSTDLDGAIAHVREINRTNSIFIGVGSKKDGQFRALEYAHDNVTVWSDSTGPDYGNHTRRPGLVYVDKHTQPDPGQGAWCLDTLMAQHYGHLDAASIVEQIAPVYQTGDSQVVVYDFQRDYMYVTYPSVSGWPSHRLNVTKAYDRPSTRFDMAALFAEPNDTK